MSIAVDAVYESGVHKPLKPLTFQEHEKVHLIIHSGGSVSKRTAGMVPWSSDPDVLLRVAEDDQFGIVESS